MFKYSICLFKNWIIAYFRFHFLSSYIVFCVLFSSFLICRLLLIFSFLLLGCSFFLLNFFHGFFFKSFQFKFVSIFFLVDKLSLVFKGIQKKRIVNNFVFEYFELIFNYFLLKQMKRSKIDIDRSKNRFFYNNLVLIEFWFKFLSLTIFIHFGFNFYNAYF